MFVHRKLLGARILFKITNSELHIGSEQRARCPQKPSNRNLTNLKKQSFYKKYNAVDDVFVLSSSPRKSDSLCESECESGCGWQS